MSEEATKIIGEVESNKFTETTSEPVATNEPVVEDKVEPGKEAQSEPETKAADYELKLEEGDTLHENDIKRANEVAKKLGLTEEQAKGLKAAMSDSIVDYTKNLEAKIMESNKAYVENNTKVNIEAIQKDPVLGGENFEKTLAAYDMAIKRYGAEDAEYIAELMDITGGKYEPKLLKMFAAIGSDLINTPSIRGDSAVKSSDPHLSVIEKDLARLSK